jgi:hypothetical protein
VFGEPINDERAHRNNTVISSRLDVIHGELDERCGVTVAATGWRRICVREIQRARSRRVVGDTDEVVADPQGVSGSWANEVAMCSA